MESNDDFAVGCLWGNAKVASMIEQRTAVHDIATSFSELSDLVVLGEYLYGYDCDANMVLSDMASNGFLLSVATYEHNR